MYVCCVKAHWNSNKSYCYLTFLNSLFIYCAVRPMTLTANLNNRVMISSQFCAELRFRWQYPEKKTLTCIFIFIGSAMVLCHWPSEVIEAIMASNLTLSHHHTTSATMEITLRWRPRESVLRSILRPRGRRCYGLERLHKGALFSRDFELSKMNSSSLQFHNFMNFTFTNVLFIGSAGD